MDLPDLIRLASAHGWTLQRRKRRAHPRLIPRAGVDHPAITVPSSPSDWRSCRNAAAQLRRAGVPVPHRGGRR